MSAHEKAIAEAEAMIKAGALDPNASRASLEYLAEQWVTSQYRRQQRRAARDVEQPAARLSSQSMAYKKIEAAVEKIVERNTSRKWTDLLDKTFALPSGQRVLWGTATVDQHQQRITQLQVLAAGNLEVAAMHRAAVTDINAAGVATLGEIRGAK